MSLLNNYSGEQFFDEMVTGESDVRVHYQRFVDRFGRVNKEEFEAKRRAVDLAFLRPLPGIGGKGLGRLFQFGADGRR